MREARIDLGALQSNIRALRAAVAPAQTMVVVKAEGYGHGAIETARAAVEAGTEWLGVVEIPEALVLRDAGITAPILTWLHGADSDFEAAAAGGIDIGISTLEQLERAGATSGLAQIQIKVDTGLSRNGIEERLARALFDRAAELERDGRVSVRGVWSHLANAGENEDREQLRRYEAALTMAADAGLRPELRHIAATAGALSLPDARYDLVRLGLGVYGLSPFGRGDAGVDGRGDAGVDGRGDAGVDGPGDGVGAGDQSTGEFALHPVMELSAEIVSVKRVPAGSGVSYGFTYRTKAETNLVLVPLGYADGIPRSASSAAPVSINGKRYTISGRVAMDQFVVDVGDDEVQVGDRAILFGDAKDGVPTADDWAAACGTINYEIVTRLGPRVTRVFVP